MSKIDDVVGLVASLGALVDSNTTAISDVATSLTAEIAKLDALNAGVGATDTQLQAVLDGLTALSDKLKAAVTALAAIKTQADTAS